MKLQCVWNEKMRFTGEAGGHSVGMDTVAPMGTDTALSPKQLVLAGICGCTGMDVVSLLRKFKQPLDSLTIDSEATVTEGGYPSVFKEVQLVFRVKGQIEPAKLLEAVTLSQTKYCSVSAMISKVAPITYQVELNGVMIGAGRADFSL